MGLKSLGLRVLKFRVLGLKSLGLRALKFRVLGLKSLGLRWEIEREKTAVMMSPVSHSSTQCLLHAIAGL